MICKICGNTMHQRQSLMVLGRHVSQLMHCRECGFLCLPEPHWLEEAYSSAIACTDTGIVTRNLAAAEQLAVLLFLGLGERGKGRYLDKAGGTGLLVRLMRDMGFDFYWSDKYAQNQLAAGFEWQATLNGECVAVTAMEVLEHVPDPFDFISAALEDTCAETFIFSTTTYAGEPPAPEAWSYYSLDTGQHISFFQRKTLEHLARRLSASYYGYGDIHVLTRSRSQLSPLFLRIACSRARKLVLPLVKYGMHGRMISDHALMLKSLRTQRGAGDNTCV